MQHLERDVGRCCNISSRPFWGGFGTDQAGKTIFDLVEAMRFYRDLAHLNFDDEAMMTDEDYHAWTGWTKEQFSTFVVYLQKAGMRTSINRTLRESLAIFWIKIKADLSFS